MPSSIDQQPDVRLDADPDTAALSQNPQFLSVMKRSRIRYAQEGGISSVDMRQRLGLAKKQDASAAAG